MSTIAASNEEATFSMAGNLTMAGSYGEAVGSHEDGVQVLPRRALSASVCRSPSSMNQDRRIAGYQREKTVSANKSSENSQLLTSRQMCDLLEVMDEDTASDSRSTLSGMRMMAPSKSSPSISSATLPTTQISLCSHDQQSVSSEDYNSPLEDESTANDSGWTGDVEMGNGFSSTHMLDLTLLESSNMQVTTSPGRHIGTGSHRRRSSNRHRYSSRHTSPPSVTSTSSSITSVTSAGLRRNTRQRSSEVPRSPIRQHSSSSASQSLRSSLDAGMAAVSRWVRSRNAADERVRGRHRSPSQARSTELRTRNRSVTWDSPASPHSSRPERLDNLLHLEELYAPLTPSRRGGYPSQHWSHHPTIFEEIDDDVAQQRQRAQSEPDPGRIRDLLNPNATRRRRRRGRHHRGRADRESGHHTTSNANSRRPQLSLSAAAALYTSTGSLGGNRSDNTSVRELSVVDGPAPGTAPSLVGTASERVADRSVVESVQGRILATPTAAATGWSATTSPPQPDEANDRDAERQARLRWIRINRRFQFVITIVALLFSLLLFAILICWVILTSSYVLSFDKSCDVPLKPYFWLVTLQLVLDVFRSDIMRFVFQWEVNSNQRIPVRVIVYNVSYLVYAVMVLRLGVMSVFVETSTCKSTAPELFNASRAFVSLSLAAWTVIVCGYIIPFCVVAALLTCNGYNPMGGIPGSADENRMEFAGGRGGSASQPVFPAAYATTGAPAGTVDKLHVVKFATVSQENSRECCICMEDFNQQDVLVEAPCKHIFHKHCCREWLKQARTCPVCRMDIAGSLQTSLPHDEDEPPRIPIGPTGRPVVGLFRIIRRTTSSIAINSNSPHASGSHTTEHLRSQN